MQGGCQRGSPAAWRSWLLDYAHQILVHEVERRESGAGAPVTSRAQATCPSGCCVVHIEKLARAAARDASVMGGTCSG